MRTLAASWVLNLTLAIAVVLLLHAILASTGIYLPIELSVIALFAALILIRRFKAVRAKSNDAVRTLAARLVLYAVVLCVIVETVGLIVTYRRGRSFDRGVRVTQPANLNACIDVRSLNATDDARLGKWIADNGADPAEYAIRTAASHQVTLFGEMHDLHENLEFFNRIIPALYTRAGVRVICLECCVSDQDADIERLITAPQFDRALQLKIARNAVWPCWGFREYWDVLETVWRVNQSRAAGTPPLRVVGIAPRVDLPSLSLFKGGPAIERLRAVRLLWNIVPLSVHDGLYAREVERATFDRNERGVVWVGAAHTPLGHWQSPRMGTLLFARYSDRVTAITLHYAALHEAMAAAIERAVAASGRGSVGFDVSSSPLAALRDGESIQYRDLPSICLADQSPGYIFLRPAGEMTRCGWMDDYVSTYMFGTNRPFYEMIAGRKFHSAAEFNAFASANAFRF